MNNLSAKKENSITRRHFLWLSSLSFAGFAMGCAVDPVTGKSTLMLVSEAEEIEIDHKQSPHQFSADYGISRDWKLNSYIDRVGRRLVPHTHRKRMPYAFKVVNATYVNAYAFPGGSIATTRGILLKLDNEAELASLLGHELGHVNARHTAEQISKSQVTSLVLSGVTALVGQQYAELSKTLGMFGAGMLLASYSRDNEREADALGNLYMVEAGYNTKGFVGLMDMLNSLSRHKPGYADLLFATHPMSQERYDTALANARGKYAFSESYPVYRERYMDNTASLRKIKGAIESMQKADTLMRKKKYSRAESYLRKALRQAPRDYAAMTMLSKCLMLENRYRDAERYAEKAQKVYPREAQAYHLSGFAKLKRKQYGSAYREFVQYDRVLPGNPNIAFFKGISLEGMGRKREAASEYVKFLKVVRQGKQAQYAHNRLVQWGYIK